MGCDIHYQFQTWKRGQWVDVATKFEGDRHYVLFAWLADVRNGYGWQVPPIARPRGVPADLPVDEEWLRPNGGWLGEHSHSWLTGDEILSTPHPVDCGYFVNEVRRLTVLHGRIRMVFGFDS